MNVTPDSNPFMLSPHSQVESKYFGRQHSIFVVRSSPSFNFFIRTGSTGESSLIDLVVLDSWNQPDLIQPNSAPGLQKKWLVSVSLLWCVLCTDCLVSSCITAADARATENTDSVAEDPSDLSNNSCEDVRKVFVEKNIGFEKDTIDMTHEAVAPYQDNRRDSRRNKLLTGLIGLNVNRGPSTFLKLKLTPISRNWLLHRGCHNPLVPISGKATYPEVGPVDRVGNYLSRGALALPFHPHWSTRCSKLSVPPDVLASPQFWSSSRNWYNEIRWLLIT
ncbi:hypothetical protein CEXT_551761 [Caerostris extrusa]|uniref:Uncharacterized protein n=1 Tax=Caerostris extrusa TaxID=172846 RepID=A0AAV4U8B4_CAEEX|nr:hypothetical protein CEXT_551761 [Caerostris extrusa]